MFLRTRSLCTGSNLDLSSRFEALFLSSIYGTSLAPLPSRAPHHLHSALGQCCVTKYWYRGTSLIRNTPLLGPYRRSIPRVLWWSSGGGAVSYERGTPEVMRLVDRFLSATLELCQLPLLLPEIPPPMQPYTRNPEF